MQIMRDAVIIDAVRTPIGRAAWLTRPSSSVS